MVNSRYLLSVFPKTGPHPICQRCCFTFWDLEVIKTLTPPPKGFLETRQQLTRQFFLEFLSSCFIRFFSIMFIFREMEQDETRNSDRKSIFMTISTNYQCWNRSDTCSAEEMLLLYESRLLSKCNCCAPAYEDS